MPPTAMTGLAGPTNFAPAFPTPGPMASFPPPGFPGAMGGAPTYFAGGKPAGAGSALDMIA